MRLRDEADLATRQTDGTRGRRSASWHFCGFTLAAISGHPIGQEIGAPMTGLKVQRP
jgi:hypothetical protein